MPILRWWRFWAYAALAGKIRSGRLDLGRSLSHHLGMERPPTSTDSAPTLEGVIFALCNATPPGHTISPTDAALAFAAARGEDALGWRSHLQNVRTAAVRLATAGRLVITRKGKPVDPKDFRGVYRLGLPREE
jgi:hypothetical protein